MSKEAANGEDQDMYADEIDPIGTVALLIDDLSSEDPNAKLNSIQSLGKISALLGPERTVDELVPMLSELIDKIDSNPELMMHLAEQLGNLTTSIGTTKDQIATNGVSLLVPLEIIVGNDDANVRQKATQALAKVSAVLSQTTIQTAYLSLIKRLKKGDVFSMRIAASHLYADIYERLHDEDKIRVHKKVKKLCCDDTPMVRWGAAQAMAVLCKHVSSVQICEFLLPLLKELLNDKNDSVKVHAVSSAIQVVKYVKEISRIQELILPALKQAYQNKTSWRLRFAVAEAAAQIGQVLPKVNVDQSILPIYITLLGDSEPEVRSESAARLPLLAKCCSSNLIVSKILPSLKLQLATESSQHVKGSMAFAVCQLASSLTQEEAAQHLIPMVSILLKNNNTEVVVSLIENMGDLVQTVGAASLEEKIIPSICTLAADKTWRIRLVAVQFFPKLAMTIGKDQFSLKLEILLVGLLMDPVFTVRENALESLVKISKNPYSTEWLLKICSQKIQEFSKHERFMIRIQSIHFINRLASEVTKDVLNKSFVDVLLTLAEDSVPNIRFNVSKTIEILYPQMTPGSKIKCESALKKLVNDQDFDCSYFAKKAMDKINKINKMY